MAHSISRRTLLGAGLAASASLLAGSAIAADKPDVSQYTLPAGFKGTIRQSLSRWCLNKYPLEELCQIGKKIGLVGLDLIQPKDWETVCRCGMIVTMGSFPGPRFPKGMSGIADGYNRTENHEWLNAGYEEIIPLAAKLKVPNIICMSGNRRGMDDETALKNCAIGLKKILPLAEKYKINLVMELLNSKNHVDYQCDRSAWGIELCKMIGSSRFSLLYDIFHMQRMEGDVINTINNSHQYFGHYHTAGNPGRKDLDDSQELYYPAIMKAIKATGFTGFVAHEFLPKKGIASVCDAIKLCDV